MRALAFVLIGLAACGDHAAFLNGAPCPCSDGYVCCEQTATCLSAIAQCPDTPLSILSLVPSHSARAGGGLIQIEGTGFDRSTTFAIGGRKCEIVDYRLEEAAVRCVIPSGPIQGGRADVVAVRGDARFRLAAAFRYDPPLLVERAAAFNTPDVGGLSVAAFDYSGDGLPDLVFGTFEDDAVAGWVNIGGLEFEPATNAPPTAGTSSLVLGDFGGDGTTDLIVGAQGDMLILERATSGEWRTRLAGITPSEDPPVAMAAVDLDADHDLDLVACRSGTSGSPLAILRNEGGRFDVEAIDVRDASGPMSCYDLRLGDIDLDGDPDVVSCGTHLVVAENRDGVFTDVTAAVSPSVDDIPSGCANVDLADLDSDGDLDIAWTFRGAFGQSAGAGTTLLFNEDGFFRSASIDVDNVPLCVADTIRPGASFEFGLGALMVEDLDDDGDADMFLPSPSSRCGIFATVLVREDAGYVASSAAREQTLLAPTGIAAADFDDDGDLDVVVQDVTGPRLFEGRTAPTGRSVVVRALTDENGDATDDDTSTDRAAWGVTVLMDLDGPADAPDFAPGAGRLAIRTLTSHGRSGSTGLPQARFGLSGESAAIGVRFPDGSLVVHHDVRPGDEVTVRDCAASRCEVGR